MNLKTQEDILELRQKSANCTKIPRIEESLSYDTFFTTYLLSNYPCIFNQSYTSHWRSRKDWCMPDGTPNFEFLQTFGNIMVPVADCKKEEYGANPKSNKPFEEYLKYWQEYIQSGYPENMECLYLKDFHFNRNFPDYEAYKTPEYFTSDWMNEFWDQRDDVQDDYRFVYMGPKGSWTPFHADVFRSFSWSANICGKKKWILYPPGKEDFLKDKLGNLVFNVSSDELRDPSKFPHYSKLEYPGGIEVIQSAGEIIFVPSGWHHQVHNLEDTISINHNWLNGCNVNISWQFIKHGLDDVIKEIGDLKDEMEKKDWYQQCQTMLKVDKGINYPEFFTFMKTIAHPRINKLKQYADSELKLHPLDSNSVDVLKSLSTTPHWADMNFIMFDIQRVKHVLEDMLQTTEFMSYDTETTGSMTNEIEDLLREINMSVTAYNEKVK